MPVNEFLVLWLSSWAAIAFFRIAPAFALRGRTLSPRVTEALGYIPPAAFAALVANDLISPGAFDVNCLPFLGHEKWEAFFMRVDLRVKHDIEARKAAIGLFELGHGYKSAAIALSLPAEAVRRWQEIYRAFGSEVLLRMDGKQGRYTYEQKVAAASAVVDGGMTKTEAMAAFGIMSMSPLKKWCALYRRGGAEALRPRPKGRPSGSRARPRTREEELEERCRRLEAEVAYLKKLRALVERDGL